MRNIRMLFEEFIGNPNRFKDLCRFVMESRKQKKLVGRVLASPLSYGLESKKSRGEKIIVSLTSYPLRFSSLQFSLKSLLLQDMKPDRIIVWLDCGEKEITQQMHEYEKYGVEYRCAIEDLKPHKKYFYAMQEFPNDLIITVDDDLVYPPDLVSSLFETHQKYPKCVCARRVHKMSFDKLGEIRPYNSWNLDCKSFKGPSKLLLATGCAGTLYPPHSLDVRAFDKEILRECALNADDIWLKFMELLHGTDVVWVQNSMTHPPEIRQSQKMSLKEKNVGRSENDACIERILDRYGAEIIEKLKTT